MTIQEKTPRERAAMTFKSAGLGDRSAREAARLLFESGLSFESAAVLGQRLDEESRATAATIREAAGRYSRATKARSTKSPWGRPLEEAAVEAKAKPPRRSAPQHHPDVTKVIDGVVHDEVVEYEQVVRESQEPRRNAWGRELKA